mmetsp:Transcript_7407/g.15397  ORF Transcript_7407/g.15397 Transcript_7407/m.15397 type:complete len:86 (+) Transcript_7407:675-932(+)
MKTLLIPRQISQTLCCYVLPRSQWPLLASGSGKTRLGNQGGHQFASISQHVPRHVGHLHREVNPMLNPVLIIRFLLQFVQQAAKA